MFLFPRQVARALGFEVTAEGGTKAWLTYRGIKSHPLGEQMMIPGGCWKLERVGFHFHLTQPVWGSREEMAWRAWREGRFSGISTRRLHNNEWHHRDFLGGPVIGTRCSHCRGHRFDPWLGNPNYGRLHSEAKKKKKKGNRTDNISHVHHGLNLGSSL